MPILFGSASAANNTAAASTSLAITAPTGIAAGHFLCAMLTCPQGLTITNPTGFTTLITQNASTGVTIRVCTKVAGTGEPGSYTFSVSGSNTTLAGSMMRFTGVRMAGPIRTSNSTGGAAVTTLASPSLTGTAASDMVVICGGARPEASSSTNDVDGPATGGWTSPAAAKSGPGNGTFPSSTAMGYQTAGTTGSFTTNVSSGIATAAFSLYEHAVPRVVQMPQSIIRASFW